MLKCAIDIQSFCLFGFCCFCFVDSIPCIALAVLELTLETKLGLNSETCLPLPPPSVGNKGVCHHTRVGVES